MSLNKIKESESWGGKMAQRLREPTVLPKDLSSRHTQEKSRALAFHQKALGPISNTNKKKLKESKAGLCMKGRHPVHVGP